MQTDYFKDQIVPVTIKLHKGDIQFDTDEHARHGVTIDDMTELKPALTKKNGTVTANNASGLNDVDAVLVLMKRSVAEERDLKPLAWLMSYGHAGVDPKIMDIGPVPTTYKASERAGLSAKNLDVIEADKVSVAQACAVTKELGLDPAKVDPNGSGISLGHPIGAAGALITVKTLHELQRIGGHYALVTTCIDGERSITAVSERI